jgi:hypothetical protein
MCKLTDKQEAFVLAYAETLNATEAARRAGYQGTYESLRVIGSQNLTKKKVRSAIDELLKGRILSAHEILTRLSDQARGIPDECFDIYGNLIAVDFEKLKEHGLLHLIKKFSYDKEGRPQIEFYDAQTALGQLGKYHSLFVERVKQEDWRSDAIEAIRRGEISYEALRDEFDQDLASELFRAAGIPVRTAIETGTSQSQNEG